MIQTLRKRWRNGRVQALYLVMLAAFFASAALVLPAFGQAADAPVAETSAGEAPEHHFEWFAPMTSDDYDYFERGALILVLLTAIAGLAYALMLVKQVREADQGTPRMQEIAAAVREGANAYLNAQFKKILLIAVITVFPVVDQIERSGLRLRPRRRVPRRRLFSWCVGFVGMRSATAGNAWRPPRCEATASRCNWPPHGYDHRHAHRRPRLLGGTSIFDLRRTGVRSVAGLRFRWHAAGIVHASRRRYLHQGSRRRRRSGGKVEAGIPEDDPRNAATIADNVGDNVGDWRRHGGRHFREL